MFWALEKEKDYFFSQINDIIPSCFCVFVYSVIFELKEYIYKIMWQLVVVRIQKHCKHHVLLSILLMFLVCIMKEKERSLYDVVHIL